MEQFDYAEIKKFMPKYHRVYNEKRTFGRRIKFYGITGTITSFTLEEIKQAAENTFSCPCKIAIGVHRGIKSLTIKVEDRK